MGAIAGRSETAFFRPREQRGSAVAPASAGLTRHAVPAVSGAWARLRRASALVVVFAILTSLGIAGSPFTPGGAFGLQAKAVALNTRWNQMEAQGVPASDLVGLKRESAAAQRTKLLTVASVFWWPDASSIIERWQGQTDAIWARNISLDRSSAITAEQKLHQALGAESLAQRKGRFGALAQASTPADFLALRFDWDLETKLVPVDQQVALEVGSVTQLAAQAGAIGILSDPAAAVLARANLYPLGIATVRAARYGPLMAEMTALVQDLHARIDAAMNTRASFGAATNAMSLASAYGVNVSGYQAQVDSDYRSYAAATTAAQFNAITDDLNQIAWSADSAYHSAVARAYHIVYGVRFYYQNHALSCEETSTSMALTHQGIYLSQDQILNELGADQSPLQYINGVWRWGNPYNSFVGNVDGIENVTGYQANYTALVRVAQAHGASVIAAGSMSAESIYAQLIANHPVVVYATWDWAWHPREDYLSYDGRWIPWMGQNYQSHVYTAIGVSPYSVLVNDPIRGQYWVSKGAFEAAFSVFHEAIVFA